jgi:hypothetical protein
MKYKKLLDHNLKEKRVQRLPLRVSLFYIKIGKPIFEPPRNFHQETLEPIAASAVFY